MASVGLGQALSMALDFLDAGRLSDAEYLCRQIIDVAPDLADAAGLLGMALARQGRAEGAAAAFLRACYLDPARADARESAFTLIEENLKGRAALIRAFVCAAPGDANAWGLMCATPDYASASKQTLRLLARAVRLDPTRAGTAARYAGVTAELFDACEAADRRFRLAIQIAPGLAGAWFNRALVASRGGAAWRDVSALSSHRAALCNPMDGEMQALVARHCVFAKDVDGADVASRRALILAPAHEEALRALASCCESDGRPDEAVGCWRRLYALTNDPSDGARLQLALNLATSSPAALLAAATTWAQAHAEPLTRTAPPPAALQPLSGRPLRVGYLIDALFTLDVTYAPLIEGHTGAIEAIVYALRQPLPEYEGRYFAAAKHVRRCAGMTAAAVADRIRQDGVDVLVEGVGFAADHLGLDVLAHRPARVQLHFPIMSTTGMTAVDACLVDAVTAPPGAERNFKERLIRLSSGYFRAPPPELPDARSRCGAGVVFGSFNSLSKIGKPTLRAWAEILRRVPQSRLLVKAPDMSLAGEVRLRSALTGEFGAPSGSLEFRGLNAKHVDHMDVFNETDVVLDSFPYGGVTTSMEAVWMGRPAVTLAGARALDRYTASFLTTLGLSDLIADDAEGYVRIACALANDAPRRAAFVRELRQRAFASPLCHGPSFIAELEAVYFDLARKAEAAR